MRVMGGGEGVGHIVREKRRRVRTWVFFFFQAEDGIRDYDVTGVQTCALPIFELLHRYTEALRSRNALLKRDSPDLALLDSFTHELVATGEKLIVARRQLVKKLSPLIRLSYRKIAAKPEDARIEIGRAHV